MVIRVVFAVVLGLLVGNRPTGAEELPSIFSEEGQHLLMGPLAAVEIGPGPIMPSKRARKSKDEVGITPRRAFLYSVLVPGAGEFFAGAKKRGAVFFGLEVVALGLYLSWNGEGNDLEDKFRAVADDKWDPLHYIAWRGSTISRNSSITHALPCSSYVNDYVATGNFGGCPDAEVQQYYELIGKYNQFVSGWTDLVRLSPTGEPEPGSLPQPADVDSVENYLSQMRLDYEIRRDDSNRYLKRASNVLGLLLVNHVISAIDAARVARSRAEGAEVAALARRTRFALVMHQGSRSQVPMLMAYKPFD